MSILVIQFMPLRYTYVYFQEKLFLYAPVFFFWLYCLQSLLLGLKQFKLFFNSLYLYGVVSTCLSTFRTMTVSRCRTLWVHNIICIKTYLLPITYLCQLTFKTYEFSFINCIAKVNWWSLSHRSIGKNVYYKIICRNLR